METYNDREIKDIQIDNSVIKLRNRITPEVKELLLVCYNNIMKKLTIIEHFDNKKELKYWEVDTESAKKVIIEPISDEEFDKIVNMSMQEVKEYLDNLLNNEQSK